MMRFKDFPIKILKPGSWFTDPKGEQASETLLRINNWIEEQEFVVLNVETLFFPELDGNSHGTGAPVFKGRGGEGISTEYYQVFRVWYQSVTSSATIDTDDLV